jgi:dihydrofolate synthase/folylpolyglutamate synthase
MTFTSSNAVFEWLFSFIDFKQAALARNSCTERIEALADLAGHPERAAPVIHIAGSKGKGSVTGMMSAMLEAAGMKTARFTSPHVSDVRERVCQGGRFFDEAVYLKAGEELVALEKALRDTHRYEALTFFDLITMFFFLCARIAGSEVMVVETGLGGRLDATNIVKPVAAVITLIELEHTDMLGDTISAIAGEKAGIIKEGRPLVLAEQPPDALAVFRERAAQKHAPLHYFPDSAEIADTRIYMEGTSFTLCSKHEKPLHLSITIPGTVQAHNAGLAVLALKTAFPSLSDEAIHTGLRNFTLPARFERLMDAPPFVVDGAHTPHSIAYCAATFSQLYGDEGILLFGCVAGKDTQSMAKALLPHFSSVMITTPGSFKKSNPEEVLAIFQEESVLAANKPSVRYVPDTLAAIEQALALGSAHTLPILGTGSFYLAADIRAAIRTRMGSL